MKRDPKLKEEEYRLLFEANPNPMWVRDRETLAFLAVNEAAIRHYGYTREEFLTMTIKDIRPPEGVPLLFEDLKRQDRDFDCRGVFTHRKKDGSLIEVEITYHNLTFAGRPARLVLANDVSERRKAERALSESYNLLQDVVEGTTDLVYVKDLQGRYLMLNSSAARVIGKPLDEIIGKTDADFFPPETALRIMESDHEILSSGETETYEQKVTTGGVTRVFHTTKGIRRDPSGKPAGVIGISRDITERKRAEESLQETEARLRLLIAQLPAIFWSTDQDLKFTSSMGAGLASLGLKTNQVVGMSLYEFFQTKDPGFLPIATHLRALNGESATYEFEWGGRVYEVHVEPFLNAEGRIIGSIGIALDITDRKQAEKALKEREEENRAILNAVPDMMFQFSKDGVFLEYKPAKGLAPYRIPGEFIGKKIEEVMPPEVTRQSMFHIRRALETDETQVYDYQLLQDGKLLDFEARIIPRGRDKVLAIVRDISDRKRMEEALKLQARVLESMAEGVNVADENGIIVFTNPTFDTMFGYERGELIGKHISVLNGGSSEERTGHTDDILNYLKINGIWKGEIDNVRKDGVLFTTRAYITSLEISNKHYWVSVQEDVTERKRSEEELLRARKLESVGLLAGGIAHDFNNILTAILGNISLAKTALDPANPLCKRLNEAERATLRAKELSRQLLTFARGGAPVKKIASIAELLKDSAGFALRGSNVRSEFLLSDDLWPVEIDEGQINQVVHNLVINAQQAMPQGGMVRISAKNMNLGKQSGIPVKGGSYVEIKIEDSGTGIPAQIIDKIFDPYFTTKQKGSGLGLSTSYSIVKKHGGHIAVLSRMGEGSSFSLYLPASPGSAQLRRNVEEKPLTGSGRILLMDDEESVLETAGEMLRHLGYEVDLAKDGLEAIALYKKAMAALRPYRAVIVDLTIPGGMGGEETISSLLKVDPGVRAVVSSGYSNDPVMADFQSYGFADFIAKPYRIEEIGRVLNKVLRDKRV